MLNMSEFVELKRNPPISDISLLLLLDFYKTYLVPYKFSYTLENKQIITIEFPLHRFPHLVGIEQIASPSRSLSISTFQNTYEDMNGVTNVENGTITINSLKRLNKSKFNSNKDKIVFFFLLKKICECSPKDIAVEYNSTAKPFIHILKYLLFSQCDNAVGHLGITQENNSFFSKSFLVKRINITSDGYDLILDNPNELLSITKIDISSNILP